MRLEALGNANSTSPWIWTLVEPSSKPKLAFFTPTGKKRFTVMPMGATNAHPVFVALVNRFKDEWDALAKKEGITNCGSQVIVDDIILYALEAKMLILYFVCVLKILKHYRCTEQPQGTACREALPSSSLVPFRLDGMGCLLVTARSHSERRARRQPMRGMRG